MFTYIHVHTHIYIIYIYLSERVTQMQFFSPSQMWPTCLKKFTLHKMGFLKNTEALFGLVPFWYSRVSIQMTSNLQVGMPTMTTDRLPLSEKNQKRTFYVYLHTSESTLHWCNKTKITFINTFTTVYNLKTQTHILICKYILCILT